MEELMDGVSDVVELVNYYINNGLIRTCIDCQFAKLKDKSKLQYKEDFMNDLVLTLYNYDYNKLLDAHTNNHFNALVTKIIVNNIYSKTSPFYKKYMKFDLMTEELSNQDDELQ